MVSRNCSLFNDTMPVVGHRKSESSGNLDGGVTETPSHLICPKHVGSLEREEDIFIHVETETLHHSWVSFRLESPVPIDEFVERLAATVLARLTPPRVSIGS